MLSRGWLATCDENLRPIVSEQGLRTEMLAARLMVNAGETIYKVARQAHGHKGRLVAIMILASSAANRRAACLMALAGETAGGRDKPLTMSHRSFVFGDRLSRSPAATILYFLRRGPSQKRL